MSTPSRRLIHSIRQVSISPPVRSTSSAARLVQTPILLSINRKQLIRKRIVPLPSSGSYTYSTSSTASTPNMGLDAAKPETMPVKRITIFGAGLMGAGIAQVGAMNGYQIVLSDVTDKALQNGLAIIRKSLGRVSKKMSSTSQAASSASAGSKASGEEFDPVKWEREVLSRIKVETDAEKAVQQADMVIEAIIENLKIKRDLFAFLDGKASQECIFASNTSSLSVAEIAEGCSEKRQASFAGVHFFNPVPAMKLVEIIRTKKTSDKAFETLMEVTRTMGKAPVGCKDTPGFIVNRLLIPYMLDAIRMVERGEATPEDIDRAMELGAGYPMGPFKLLDFVGLDTTSHISTGWRDKAEQGLISKDLVRPIPLLDQMIKDGRYGKKSGRGFYDYSSKL